MKESQDQELLEYSESRHLGSKKSFDSYSHKLKDQEDIKSVHMDDMEEIPKRIIQKAEFEDINFEEDPIAEKEERKDNDSENVVFK